jgi:hypothetical protein
MKPSFLLVSALLCILAGCSKFHHGPKPDANGVLPDGTLAEGHSALQVNAADTKGKPIAGARVEVEGGGVTRKGNANKEGWCTFFLPPASYAVIVTKDGYVPNKFTVQLQSTLYTSADSKLQTVAEAQAEQEAQAKQREVEEQAAKNKPVIDSLNVGDVEQRCGEPRNLDVDSTAPYFLYPYYIPFPSQYGVDSKAFGGYVKDQKTGQYIWLTDIEDVTLWFGAGGQPINEADVDTDGSNHPKTIDKYVDLPKVMPCLLQGGVAK